MYVCMYIYIYTHIKSFIGELWGMHIHMASSVHVWQSDVGLVVTLYICSSQSCTNDIHKVLFIKLCTGCHMGIMWFISMHSNGFPPCAYIFRTHTIYIYIHIYTYTHIYVVFVIYTCSVFFYLIEGVVSTVAPVTVLAIWDIRGNLSWHVHASLCGVTQEETPPEAVACSNVLRHIWDFCGYTHKGGPSEAITYKRYTNTDTQKSTRAYTHIDTHIRTYMHTWLLSPHAWVLIMCPHSHAQENKNRPMKHRRLWNKKWCAYSQLCVCVSERMYARTHKGKHATQTRSRAQTQTHTNKHKHEHIDTHTHTHTHTHLYTYIHTHEHSHTNTDTDTTPRHITISSKLGNVLRRLQPIHPRGNVRNLLQFCAGRGRVVLCADASRHRRHATRCECRIAFGSIRVMSIQRRMLF
jgi:hypothetical protein